MKIANVGPGMSLPTSDAAVKQLTWIGGPGTLTSDPIAVSMTTNRVDVNYFRDLTHMDHGYSDDNGSTFFFSSWDPGGLAAPRGETYLYMAKPAIASAMNRRLDMFATVLVRPEGNMRLLHRSSDPGQSVGWSIVSTADAITAPAAVGWTIGGSPRIDVFAVNSLGHLLHWYSDSTLDNYIGPDDWGSPSGDPLESDPAVASWGDGRLDILASTGLGHIAHYWWDNGNFGQNLWPKPDDYELRFFGGPAIAAPAGANFLWPTYIIDETVINRFIPRRSSGPAITLYDNGNTPSIRMRDIDIQGIAVCAGN
jgi:hypothetical protein